MSYTSSYSDSTDYYHVHLGIWTNWSRGPLFGPTITMNRREGALLIAFIASFVTFVGTSSWRLLCFTLHYLYSTEAARGGLYHQRQAILRNSANGTSALWSFGRSLYKWQAAGRGAYRRLVPLILFIIIILVTFGVASSYSSRISAIGNEVLVTSPNWGMPIRDLTNNSQDEALVVSYYVKKTISAANYAKQCYSSTSNPENCQGLFKKRLAANVNRNAPCPFNSELCLSENKNLMIDTGFLNSHDDFGFNTSPDKRFLFRNVMHCAPINTTIYEERSQYMDGTSKRSLIRYHLGNLTTNKETISTRNWIYTYPETSIPELDETWDFPTEYTLHTSSARSYHGKFNATYSDFYPIPELRSTNSTLTLLFLSANGIYFIDEVDDDWYSAHRLHTTANADSSATSYLQDKPASLLACKWQDQCCNANLPSGNQCTPLSDNLDTADSIQGLARNEDETDLLNWLYGASIGLAMDLQGVIITPGISLLTSRDSLALGFQGYLPDNQWQLDAEYWFSVYLASLQKSFVDMATGPSDPRIMPFLDRRVAKTCENGLCKQQKIRSNAYTNFSILGLCLIIVVGSIIIILSYTIESLLEWIRKRRNLDIFARLEWCANETLQLQRLAHEGIGVGSWADCDGAVPVTRADERLAVLDVNDPKYPRLKAPPVTSEELLMHPSASTVNH